MKTSSLTLIVLGLVTSCDRDHPREPIASSPPVTSGINKVVTAPMPGSLRAEAEALILSRTSSGQVSSEALTKLQSIAPKLLEADLLIDVLVAVPLDQLTPFTDLVFESVSKLEPKAGQAFNPKYEDAIRLAEHLEPQKLAPLVFDHLTTVPPYEFPTSELPGGWGDASHGVHAWKGTQGLIATIVVRYGDNELMERYRNLLKTASPQLQRVMAWALSRSTDAQDFELLWNLYSHSDNPALADTAKRAMNVIPRTMEALANNADITQENRGRLSPDDLKASAKALTDRLQAANLTVPLTVWD